MCLKELLFCNQYDRFCIQGVHCEEYPLGNYDVLQN